MTGVQTCALPIWRNSAGVRLFDVGKAEHVVGAARIEAEDEGGVEVGVDEGIFSPLEVS